MTTEASTSEGGVCRVLSLDGGGAKGFYTLGVIAAGAAIAALVLIGKVEITWSFSAFTVLIYYAITNLAALRLPEAKRLYSPIIAWAGLAACLSLAFFVEREIWIVGVGIILAGLVWHSLARYFAERR